MTRHRVAFGSRQVPLPRSKGLRIALGTALLLGGLVGFLPVLGFWMIPLGLIILSIDIAVARRLRRRSVVWWGRRRGVRRERS
ncbi:hypothetical protein [Microvirga sp. TS319]|uniref:hypothetical protein n=1 Tax=Microvirga sp. TS319 TaxID=3241165 RepID=UPI00351A1E8E